MSLASLRLTPLVQLPLPGLCHCRECASPRRQGSDRRSSRPGDHVTGPAGDDLPWFAVVVAAGINEPSLAQAELGEVPSDRTAVDREAELGEFAGDALGGPLVLASPGLDLLDDPRRRRVGTPVRRRRSVQEPCLTMLSPSVDLL